MDASLFAEVKAMGRIFVWGQASPEFITDGRPFRESGERKKVSSKDDPSFPATIYARLVEGEDGAHNLIWSRSKGD